MHRGPGAIKSRLGSKSEKHKQALLGRTAVSITMMVTNSGVSDASVVKIEAEMEQLFMHELEFYTERSAR
jgi:hypothetical protein